MEKIFFQKGFAALFVAILILAIILSIGLSVAIFVLGEQKIASNIVKSSQAYYSAEAGIEDALLRVADKNPYWSLSYSFWIGESSVVVNIPVETDNSREITAEGDFFNRKRKVKIDYATVSQDVAFYYGIQVGDLGLEMDVNTKVIGNIYSNGPITGVSSGQSVIEGSAISAGNSGIIQNVKTSALSGGGDAWANTLKGVPPPPPDNCEIEGDAYYNNIDDCTVSGSHFTPISVPEPQDMPIMPENIQSWKDEAIAGGTVPGYTLGGVADFLGPKKVDGNLIIDSKTLTVTGTIWITGDLTINQNADMQLDPGYGSFSGTIVVGGHIIISSNVTICGTEGLEKAQTCNPSNGTYFLFLSTYSWPDSSDPAIDASSNTDSAILYAADGFIEINSNASIKEATGYGVHMNANSSVSYEIGLANARFSSGPGGVKKVISWKEVE